MPDNNAPVSKTPYSDKELDHFRELLLHEQQETKDEISELRQSLEDLNSANDDVSSSQDHHVGDLGSDEEIRETDYTLIERNLAKLEEINAAIDRVANGSYGVCDETGKKIQKERLEAIPYARYSIEAQKYKE